MHRKALDKSGMGLMLGYKGSHLVHLSLKFNILSISEIQTSERKPTQNHILVNNQIPRTAKVATNFKPSDSLLLFIKDD